MNNSATTSPTARPIRPRCSFGQPNCGKGTGTGAGEKEPQSVYGARIAQAALQSVGVSTEDFPVTNTGNPEYAASVSIIFTKATEQAIIPGTAMG